MWIQEKNENRQGQTSDQPAQTSRQKKAVRLTLPKSARLRKKIDYQRLARKARRLGGATLFFFYTKEGAELPRLGITVSRKYGKAFARNRFKRVVREAFRQITPQLPRGLSVNVSPLDPKISPSTALCLKDFTLLC